MRCFCKETVVGESAGVLAAMLQKKTTPTRVAISIAVNPVAAALVGALLIGEVIRWNLSIGIVAVVVGIWIATRPDSVSACKATAAP